MYRFKRLVSLILALSLLLLTAVACTPEETPKESSTPGTTESTPESTPQSSSTPESSPETSPESSSTSLKDLIPEDMDLNREMSILAGKLVYDEWLTLDSGDLVGTEIYNRVLRVEENLGIELEVTTIPGGLNSKSEFMSEVKKRHETSDPNLKADVISAYSKIAGSITLEGRFYDLGNSDYLDLNKPWWPTDLLENSTIDDKIYCISGDISPTLIYETYAIFYNRKLIEKYNISDPIKLVNEHKWTLDKLIELTSGIYEDLDQTTVGPSLGDVFALSFNDMAHLKAFPFAMGIRVLTPDEDDGYVFSETYISQKMEDIANKITTWMDKNPGVKCTDFYDYGDSFISENCIFAVGNFAFAAQWVAGTGVDYAVVPCPLYNTDQDEYYSYYGNPTSFWGVPTNAIFDDSCALIQSLAADAYVYISPALFERALKYKYVTDEVDGLSHMFDIIRDGLVFDACMLYAESIGGAYKEFQELAYALPSWMALFSGFRQNSMKLGLSAVVKKLRELEY